MDKFKNSGFKSPNFKTSYTPVKESIIQSDMQRSSAVVNDVSSKMQKFATARSIPMPVPAPAKKSAAKITVDVDNNESDTLEKGESVKSEPVKKTRKPRQKAKTSVGGVDGRSEYREWLIAVLDLFNLGNAFTGSNYNDSTIAIYTTTAKKMRLMGNEFNTNNPDKTPIDASIVREFYAWMVKKGWKDIGQKALVDRFPEYIASISEKPVDAPYRVTQLKKWVSAEEKRTKKSVSDEDRMKLQELLDIEIITNYHQLVDQIPKDELQRLKKGLEDGSIYNPFN